MTGRTVIQLRQGKEILEIEGRSVVLGRSNQCDLQVDDTGVSRRHCELILDNRGLALRDLGSRHGTWVDGKRLDAEARIRAGQILSLGQRGPQYQVAGALMNGYPMAGAPGTSQVIPRIATPVASPATRGFGVGLMTGLAVAILGGLAALAFVDISDQITSTRDRLGAEPLLRLRPEPIDGR